MLACFLGCMPRAYEGHVKADILIKQEEIERESAPTPITRRQQERINLKQKDLEQVEPPPEPKYARTSRRLRQMQHEAASSNGHRGGQSGYPGSPEVAPDGQSGNPGPSGVRFCSDASRDAVDLRSFVGKLYLRTHGKYSQSSLEACHTQLTNT